MQGPPVTRAPHRRVSSRFPLAARGPAVGALAVLLAAQLAPAACGIPWVTRRITTGIPAAGSSHVVFTFDDGPHPDGTPAVLDALAEADASATFFVIGEQAARRPDLLRRIAAAGHEIGVHGWNHRLLPVADPTAILRELRHTVRLVEDAAGVKPTRYRPPFGVATAAALAAAHRLGLAPTWWTVWGRDWDRTATADTIVHRVTAGLARRRLTTGSAGSDNAAGRAGCRSAVVLLHDSDAYAATGSWRATAAATRILLRTFTETGCAARSLADFGR